MNDELSQDTVAIVGMACRFPGGIDSPESLWRFLIEGKHTSSKFPPDRSMTELADMASPEVAAAMAPMGGFIDEPGQFDPEFFGISPREARAMDPQQRMVLETTWQALEDAGIDPNTLRDTDAGVYVGAMGGDYAYLIPGQKDLDPGYVSLGVSQSVLSGRVSYILGLQGPTMSIDTACSSSLVAMQLGGRALQNGECTLALVGGVSIMSTLTGFFALGQHGAISKEGRSRPYSADADGFCMSEGVAMLVLERLSDARANGHRVLAVMRGSAVNQDGATKGLTVPSTPAQQKLIRSALADAGLAASEIDVVEGHGTGTPVGDPIELRALFDTYGQDRPEGQPLKLGSIKGNFGHTQAAAGAAGVIKMIQAMRHGVLPSTVNISEPTPAVDWSHGTVELATQLGPWPDNGHPRRAGVSSFGIAGTNAHVILEQAPPVDDESASSSESAVPVAVWAISGKTPEALADQAARLAEQVRTHPEYSLRDIGSALATTRATFDQRAVVLGTNRVDLLAGLAEIAEAKLVGPIRGQATSDRRVAFVFPGQGAQFQGMAAQLMDESPLFLAQMQACGDAFAEFVDWSLLDVLREVDGAPSLERVDVVQPALFATMVSLAALWRSYGIEPAAVIGHSQGEVAAAYVAGALSLEHAARIVTMRSKPLRTLPGSGGMASINASAARVRELMAGLDDLYIAAINSPSTTVVAGGAEPVSRIIALAEENGVRAKRVPVDYAAHTCHLDPLQDELRAAVAPIVPQATDVVFFSTVTGDILPTEELGPDYWFRNLREPVDFEEGFQAAFQSGFDAFIELSVNPVLTSAMHESLDHAGSFADSALIVGSIKREDAGIRRFLQSVAEAYVKGVSPDWTKLYPVGSARPVTLPTYAFQRQKYWLASVANTGGGKPSGLGLTDAGHPLLGAVSELPGADRYQFSNRLSLQSHPWLADHALHGNVLLPGAMLLELALHAGDSLGFPRVEKLTMYTPVTLPAEGAIHLQLVVSEAEQGKRRKVAIYSRPEVKDEQPGASTWSLHADGLLTTAKSEDTEGQGLELWPPVGAEPGMDPESAYRTLAALGYHYGPVFQGMKAVWKRGDEVFAEIALPDSVSDADKYGLHPALLDSAMQSGAAGAALLPSEEGAIQLPFAWERVELRAVGAKALRVRLTPVGSDRLRWVLADNTGRVVAIGTLQVRSISMGKLATRGMSGRQDSLFGVDWLSVPVQRTRFAGKPGEWAVIGGEPFGVVAEAGALSTYADLDALGAALEAGAEVPKVVLLPRFAASAGAEPGSHVTTAVRDELTHMLTRLQTWFADERFAESKLIVLTRGVQGIDIGEEVSDLVGATVWALVRSAQSEFQDRIQQIDLDDADISLDQLSTAAQLDEPELALRRGEFFGRRLRSGLDAAATVGARLAGDWRLAIPASGNLDDVTLAEIATDAEESTLAPGAVQVALRAAGLSFPVALAGLAADTTATPSRLVHEASGVVTAVGAEVDGIAVGERVFGLFDEITATAVTDQRLLAAVPAGWSFAQAAAAPIAYLTALHGLRDVAAAKTGERVLVHAATGGVGTAAVNLARHLGLEVLATASKPKWDVLRSMGFAEDSLADSRSSDFAARFAERGIDIVLNLLPDTFTEDSLGLLGDGGRFVEIARHVVREAATVEANYSTFELGALDADLLGELLIELAVLFESGALAPLPLTRFDVRHASPALRHLSEARHTGKVVLTWSPGFDPESTVLITGGTGTIGAIIARHLVTSYGAKHLVLTSRSGAQATGIAELVAELEGKGATVTVAACDAGDRDAIAAVLDSVPAAHPLGGVVHLAAALADSTFAALTADDLDAVLPAKSYGAWYLHDLTKHLDLSMFVLFSSAAGTFGSAGQANYGAANVFLDSLARHRYHRGLPATAMAWGWWAEDTSNTGSMDEKDRSRLTRMGVTPMPTKEALELFDAALHTGRPHVLPVGMDLSLLRVASQVTELPPFFRALLHTRPRATQQMGDSSQLAKRLSGLSPSEQHAVIVDLLKTPISMVLGYSAPDAVQPDREFTEMGIDSLSSIELGAHLRALTGVKLANSVIFQYPTVNLLARHVLDQVTPQDAELADPIVAEVEMLLDRLAAIHEDGDVPEELVSRLSGAVDRLGGTVTTEAVS